MIAQKVFYTAEGGKIYGDVAFHTLPEDDVIAESLMKRKPAYMLDKNSDFSLAIDELANDYALRVGEAKNVQNLQSERSAKPSAFSKFAKWFVK